MLSNMILLTYSNKRPKRSCNYSSRFRQKTAEPLNHRETCPESQVTLCVSSRNNINFLQCFPDDRNMLWKWTIYLAQSNHFFNRGQQRVQQYQALLVECLQRACHWPNLFLYIISLTLPENHFKADMIILIFRQRN